MDVGRATERNQRQKSGGQKRNAKRGRRCMHDSFHAAPSACVNRGGGGKKGEMEMNECMIRTVDTSAATAVVVLADWRLILMKKTSGG